MSDNIKTLIEKLAGTWNVARVKTCYCEVVSVDKENRTCLVNSADGTQELENTTVNLTPEIGDGEIDYPLEGSTITVAFTDFTAPYMVKAGELESKFIVVGNQLWTISGSSQKFNDGAFGGIPKVKDPDDSNAGLLKKINDLENALNDLQTKFSSWTPVSNDGGAALKTILTITPPIWNLPQIELTSESDISNPNITHGKSIS